MKCPKLSTLHFLHETEHNIILPQSHSLRVLLIHSYTNTSFSLCKNIETDVEYRIYIYKLEVDRSKERQNF